MKKNYTSELFALNNKIKADIAELIRKTGKNTMNLPFAYYEGESDCDVDALKEAGIVVTEIKKPTIKDIDNAVVCIADTSVTVRYVTVVKVRVGTYYDENAIVITDSNLVTHHLTLNSNPFTYNELLIYLQMYGEK